MSLHDIAKQVQSKGRNSDKVLVHMTPEELGGLQHLAMAHGGSLTINPETGLVEAGFLKKILPMVAGAVLAPMTAGIINPATLSAMIGAAGTGIGLGKGLGGSLKQGLMAGLGAYGGASLGAAAGIGSTGTALAAPTAGTAAGQTAQNLGRTAWANEGMAAFNAGAPQLAGTTAGLTAAPTASPGVFGAFKDRFVTAASKPMIGAGTSNFMGSYAPMVASAGALQGISKAATPSMPKFNTEEEEKSNYAGPYEPTPRVAQFPGVGGVAARDPNDSSEFQYFDRVNPTPSYMPSSRLLDQRGVRDLYPTAAAGGEMNMKDGAFVLDARTVSELGNGSSNAGKEALSRIGGVPINGPGDGVSDSIHARIGGTQEARVARDEVMVPPEVVKDMGGAGKFYALMDKAHKARKTADRGEDTGLARGLMA